MSSLALIQWRSVGLARLDELEQVHAAATRGRRGSSWGTEQLNRSLFVALVAQFQEYCRELHDGAAAVHVAAANPKQATVVFNLLTEGRRLQSQNPRVGHLGSDFGRLGFSLVDELKLADPAMPARLRQLDLLIDFRNAISHGDETMMRALTKSQDIRATKAPYRRFRKTLDQLAGTMDEVVGSALAAGLQIPPPW